MKQVIATLLILASFQANAQNSHPITAELDHQFDFWIGEWDVNLLVRQADFSWKSERKSVAKIYPVADGRAILELWNEAGAAGIKGFSLRYYDFDLGKWVLWLNWPNKNRSGTSSLEGEFRHGRGEFFSTFKTQEGKDGITRYSFSDISPTSLRWDDAFSADGGKTWSNNWIMEFSRTKSVPSFDNDDTAHTYEQGKRCNLPEFARFNKLAGTLEGLVEEKTDAGAITTKATMTTYKVLGGCSVISFLEYGDEGARKKVFSLKTYNTFVQKFADLQLSNEKTSKLERFYGQENNGVIELSTGQEGGKTIAWTLDDDKSVSFKTSKKSETGDEVLLMGKFLIK